MAAARCVYCNFALPTALLSVAGSVVCPGCQQPSAVIALPALLQAGLKPPPPLDPPGEGDAACFYSPNRKATQTCNHCGVLMSEVWSAQWGSKVVCLKCLEHLREQSKDASFQSTRTLWDNVALLLAIAPVTLIMIYFSFITAPAAVFLALWHWNSPRTLVPRSRFRLVVALLLGLAQVVGGILLICGLWFGWFKTGRNA